MIQKLTSARRVLLGRRALTVLAIVIAVVVVAWFLESTKPRRIVMASGPVDGLHHELALRYQAILARNGVTVVERITAGADENARLLSDPHSGVDVAFMLGGVVPSAEREGLEMIAALYYEPLWVFYRGTETLSQLDELRYKRIAIGAPGQGVRAFLSPCSLPTMLRASTPNSCPLATSRRCERCRQARSTPCACWAQFDRQPSSRHCTTRL